MKQYISVDLGGTNIRAALFDEQLNLITRSETHTLAHEGFEPVMGRIKAMIQAVFPAAREAVAGIGICVPGPVDPETGFLFDAANLPGWLNIPVSQILRDTFGIPVFTGNDANLAALAEYHHGAARGCRHVVFLTISTGIGGGIINDGKLLTGRKGMAGEVGHTHLVVDGEPQEWEHLAAGPGMIRRLCQRLEKGEASVIREWVQGDLNRIDGKMINDAAQQDDALAKDVIQQTTRLIGIGVNNLVLTFSPDIVVIGGGLTNLGDDFFEQIRAVVKQYGVSAFVEGLRVVPAVLQDNAGLIGAAALAREGTTGHQAS
jgi:glucokinase